MQEQNLISYIIKGWNPDSRLQSYPSGSSMASGCPPENMTTLF